MTHYFITPIHENLAHLWEKVYGRTSLPVKYPYPHLACTQRWGDVPVYYLDVTAVPEALLNRLATYEARRLGINYHEARHLVHHEWLIRAEGCQVEKAPSPETPSWQAAFPFLPQVPLRPSLRKLRPVASF